MEDPIVTLLDGTKMPKSQVPIDTIFINENGVKVKKTYKENPNDPLVTLLDGTKIPKSKVPIDTIYINENGQKVKKVCSKANNSKATQDNNNLFSNIGGKINTTFSNVKESIVSSYTSTKESVEDFAVKKIQDILKKIDIDSTLVALKTYQTQSGKDIQKLIDFIVKLKNIK